MFINEILPIMIMQLCNLLFQCIMHIQQECSANALHSCCILYYLCHLYLRHTVVTFTCEIHIIV